jgi:hypothetical protein
MKNSQHINKSLLIDKSSNKSETKEYKELYISADEFYIIDDNSSVDTEKPFIKKISFENDYFEYQNNNGNDNNVVKINKIMCDKAVNTETVYYYNIKNSDLDSNEQGCPCSCTNFFKKICSIFKKKSQ